MNAPPDDYILHDPAQLGPDQYWACEVSEGPLSPESVIDPWCRTCVLALGADALVETHIVSHGDKGEEPEFIDSAEFYEELRHDVGLPPLPVRVS